MAGLLPGSLSTRRGGHPGPRRGRCGGNKCSGGGGGGASGGGGKHLSIFYSLSLYYFDCMD